MLDVLTSDCNRHCIHIFNFSKNVWHHSTCRSLSSDVRPSLLGVTHRREVNQGQFFGQYS